MNPDDILSSLVRAVCLGVSHLEQLLSESEEQPGHGDVSDQLFSINPARVLMADQLDGVAFRVFDKHRLAFHILEHGLKGFEALL